MKNLLPLGSVVLLKDATRKLVITGFLQFNNDNKKKTYDYQGVVYPQGYIGLNSTYLFDNDDIKEVIYKGYEGTEHIGFVRLVGILTDEIGKKTDS